MRWLNQLFTRRHRYAEFSDSIREHLDEKIADLIDHGMTRQQAGSAARREFGNVTLIKERIYETRISYHLKERGRRFATGRGRCSSPEISPSRRWLRLHLESARTPRCVINSVLLKPWPFPDSGRLVWIDQGQANGSGNLFSTRDFLDWKQHGDCSPTSAHTFPGSSISALPEFSPIVFQVERFPLISFRCNPNDTSALSIFASVDAPI